jgi:hypothetical protein
MATFFPSQKKTSISCFFKVRFCERKTATRFRLAHDSENQFLNHLITLFGKDFVVPALKSPNAILLSVIHIIPITYFALPCVDFSFYHPKENLHNLSEPMYSTT